MKNPFGQIVSFEDYVDIIGIPKEQLNSEEVKNRINKWLVQATEQFDSMISGNGQLGRLYRWFEKLEDNEEDNYKKYKLIKAICSWVETFVIKGKFWVDGLPVINSNVDIQINSSSTDSNVEAKRKDIIQDLVSVGLYQTTNFGDNNTYQDNQQSAEQLIEDLIVLSTSELQQNYLRLNPQKSLEGNLDFANNDLVNGGNIIGSTQQARNNIQYYNIIDSTIDLNRNTIIGTLGQDPTTANDIAQINQNIANINQEQITQNTNISNNENEINALKAKDTEQNNKLIQLEQKTTDNSNEITNIKTKDQQQDNSIQSNTTLINTNTNSINTLNQQVANNKNLLDQTIDGLRALKPFEYVGEFQQGTSYKTNQLVSLNNNLYLSKEDNNTTTPPGDKWLLLDKDFASIDLSDYYTKLEVDTIKSNLQNNITSNTNNITTNQTNITNLNNEVVKIAGNQTITGEKTFDNQVIIRKDGTPLTLRAVNPGKIYMLMKGADDTTNFSLGANSSNTSLEVNRGDLTLTTQQANKNVNFENVARIKFNRSVLEMGTEINAGFGGGEVKFIPEDNSTKTLKFYNNQPNDTRRFNLLVPNPTAAQNPATKQYVDNAIANITPGSGGSGGNVPQDLVNRVQSLENNSVSKTTTTPQTIASQITFTGTDQVLKFNSGTNNSAYLAGYKSGNQRVWYFGKGSSTSDNFIIGADSGVIKLEPSTHVDVSNKKIINVADPTADQDAANKRYVDNAIATAAPTDLVNRVDQIEQNVNTNSSSITDLNNKHNQQQTLIDTNKNNIQTNTTSIDTVNQNLTSTQNLLTQTIDSLRTLRPFKYVGAYSSSTTYKINEMVSYNNAFYLSVEDNNSTTPSTTNNKWIVMENFQQVDLTNYATKLELQNAQTNLQSNINNNNTSINRINSDIDILRNTTVKTSTDQTINGTKTFTNQIKANGGLTTNTNGIVRSGNLELGYGSGVAYITPEDNTNKTLKFSSRSQRGRFDLDMGGASKITNLPNPINNQDAATKQYVDRTVDSMINIYTDNTTKHNNLKTINLTDIFSRTNINYNKPLIVSFTRYNVNQGSGNTVLGTHTGIIYKNTTGNKHMVISDTYIVPNGNMTDGRRAGLLITPTQIKIQCWDGNDRIGNITIYGWTKAIS